MIRKIKLLKGLLGYLEKDSDFLYTIDQIINEITYCLETGHKILICGNGGSQAEAEHIAAEFTGRFKLERTSLPAINLGSSNSSLTAIANDYGYDKVFSRQVMAYGQPGDIFIGLSTSGNSKNVINAMDTAQQLGILTIAITGNIKKVKMDEYSDIIVQLSIKDTDIIQELHLMILHYIVEQVEKSMFGGV